jgi:DNA modification methylase
LTDPPYGIGKAEWDIDVPELYVDECFRITESVCIMPGLWAIGKCINLMGDRYKSIIAGHNKNGMTYSPIGFGNWIPAVVGGKITSGQDAFDFIIDEIKPPHPSPKPLRFMRWLVNRLSEENDVIVDPFGGSFTTAVAAKQLGRQFIGIEIEKKYCDIAVQRLAQGVLL